MRGVRALSNDHTPLPRACNGAPFHSRISRGALSSLARALVAARLPLGAVEIAAALRALFQEQMVAVKGDGLGALHFHEDWGFHRETAFYLIARIGDMIREEHAEVSEVAEQFCFDEVARSATYLPLNRLTPTS